MLLSAAEAQSVVVWMKAVYLFVTLFVTLSLVGEVNGWFRRSQIPTTTLPHIRPRIRLPPVTLPPIKKTYPVTGYGYVHCYLDEQYQPMPMVIVTLVDDDTVDK